MPSTGDARRRGRGSRYAVSDAALAAAYVSYLQRTPKWQPSRHRLLYRHKQDGRTKAYREGTMRSVHEEEEVDIHEVFDKVVADALQHEGQMQDTEAYKRALANALEWCGLVGGVRARTAHHLRRDRRRLKLPEASCVSALPPEVFWVPGMPGPLVVFRECPVVFDHFKDDLIRAVRRIQAVDDDESGRHRFAITYGLFKKRSAEQIWDCLRHQPDGIDDDLKGEESEPVLEERRAEVGNTVRDMHAAHARYQKAILEGVIKPYLGCISLKEHIRPGEIKEGFWLDYRLHGLTGAVGGEQGAAEEEFVGSGLGAHVDSGAWSLITVLPCLDGEEWAGCELLFNSSSPLVDDFEALDEDSRLTRMPMSTVTGPAANEGGDQLLPLPGDGRCGKWVHGLALQPGDIVCMPPVVHAVNDIRRPEQGTGNCLGCNPRRQSLVWFMGVPVGVKHADHGPGEEGAAREAPTRTSERVRRREGA